MRTTISLDDSVFERLKSAAAQRATTVSRLIEDAVRVALDGGPAQEAPRPFRLVTWGHGGPAPGVDLDRTSALLLAEDADRYGGPR